MKKTLFAAFALVATALCRADSVTDFQAGVNYNLKFVTSTYSVNNNGVVTTGNMPAAIVGLVTKAGGSLTGSINFASLFPTLGISTLTTFTGTNLGSNKLKLAVTSPSLIGQTITLNLGTTTFTVKVTAFSGTLNTVCSRTPMPISDTFSGTARNTEIAQDTATPSSILLVGTNATKPFTLTIKTINSEGIGGGVVNLFPSLLTFSSEGGNVRDGVQGGRPGLLTVTMSKPVTASTVVAMSYQGTAVTAPSTITIPAGLSSGSAAVATSFTPNLTYFAATATYQGYVAKSAPLGIAPAVAYWVFTGTQGSGPSTFPGGSTVTATLITATPVASTVVVTLYGLNPDLAIPATVTIPGGQRTVSFNIKTPLFPSGGNEFIFALFPGNTVYVSHGSFALLP